MDNLTEILLSQATISDPLKYANIIKATRSDGMSELKKRLTLLRNSLESAERSYKSASEFRRHVSGDDFSQRRKKAKTVFEGLDKQAEGMHQSIDVSVLLQEHYNHIIEIYRNTVRGIELMTSANIITYDKVKEQLMESFLTVKEELGQERSDALIAKIMSGDADVVQALAIEQKMNVGATTAFIQGIRLLGEAPRRFVNFLRTMTQVYEQYYERLRHRHTVEGFEIVSMTGTPSVTLTDVAMLVWKNVDRAGEIDSGSDRDQLSAFTLHRANAMLTAAKRPDIWSWLLNPGKEISAWADEMFPMIDTLHNLSIDFKSMIGESTWEQKMLDIPGELDRFHDVLNSLDLSQIVQKEPEQALSRTERFSIAHRNKSIKKVADHLVYGDGTIQEIVEQVIKLRIEEHKFFVHENSFYVCRIGTGNTWAGEPPGQIEVIPGEKPIGNLEHIWGGGFKEMKDFISGMKDVEKWQPLFLATSPSKSTDKKNVLLVGPQGCGKTELLRAVGADNSSVSIFAVGSDFLTCWLGEAQKNPKRLFNEAIKLQKSSGLPVYILIDEIDMVLNDEERGSTRVNLSLEFQNLMDGVVAYPGISIWGATNHPERIPTPMLRRFAKVEVVGELGSDDIKSVLRHYIESFLPCENNDLGEENYDRWAKNFTGATGDVLRKMVDRVWLSLIRDFIANYPEAADKALEMLKAKHGGNFEVGEFTDEDRKEIREIVGESVRVTPSMIDKNIEETLNNSAIQKQIKVAKDTYKTAKQLLEKQKSTNNGIGFS